MGKFAYEYGRRWNLKTPRRSIKWILEEVLTDIRARIAAQGSADFTPTIVRQCEEYARIVHERNGALYRRVML